MKGHAVEADTVHEAIRLALEVAEADNRDVEPNSFRYSGEINGKSILWFMSYPRETE